MTVIPVVAIASAWLLGVLLCSTFWPRGHWRADLALILPVGALLGLGATSMIFFGASLVSTRPTVLAVIVEATTVLALFIRIRTRRMSGVAAAVAVRKAWSWMDAVLALVFLAVCVAAAVIAWRAYRAEPLGGWDGWAIWNMHARFMLRAGTRWPELLGASQLNWTHPDYPRLVPASVARVWGWSGDETPAGSALVSVSFALALVATLVAFITRKRGRAAALTGGIVLVATPFFVTFASNEHADIPLASYLLATVVVVCLAAGTERANGLWAIAGFTAACAAWTKNEGWLFVALASALIGGGLWRQRDGRAAVAFFVSLGVALLPVLYFKLRLAPPNDLASPPLGPRVAQLFDPARHSLILKTLWRDLGAFGEWRIAPWVALALPLLAWRRRTSLRGFDSFPLVLAALMLAGYYVVYLLTPLDLTGHLDTSLVRLLLQLWPLVIAGWGLLLPSIDDVWPERWRAPARLRHRPIVAGAAGGLVVTVLYLLSLQRGMGEVAVRRFGFSEVSAMLADGWFPLERHDRDEWAWSSGRGAIELYVAGSRAIDDVRLRFELGTVGARRVEIRSGSRVLWQGALIETRVAVTVGPLTLSPGLTRIDVSTDAPGVAESAAAGGRTLAFAIYNVRIE